MDKVVNILFEIGVRIHMLLNGENRICEDNFCEKCKYPNIKLNHQIYDIICNNILAFYTRRNDDDEFLLVLGFSINIYYVAGLYPMFGKFDVNALLNHVDSYEVREYGNLINEFIYSRIVEKIRTYIYDTNEEITNSKFNELKNMDLETIYRKAGKLYKNYVPELYMLIKENNYNRESEFYLNEMIGKYPNFRFGLVYRCIQKGLDFYASKGENIEMARFKSKLGNKLFNYVVGLDELDCNEFEAIEGELRCTRLLVLGDFGIGIPRIETYHYKELTDDYNPLIQKIEAIHFKDIIGRTKGCLGIGISAIVYDSPLKFTRKLFGFIEKQNDELEMKNKELSKLNEQRRKMIDQLAHSWGNECYPEIVRNVAIELIKNGKSSLANKLFKAYHSEKDLMGGIIYLQAAMEDEPEKLKNIFSDSFLISGKGNKEWKMQSVIEESLENLVFSLLNYKGDKLKRNVCKKKLCVKFSLEKLMEDYSKRFEDVDSTETESFIQWFSYNVFPVTIKSDEVWDAINFGNTEYGKIVIKNIFTELFTNVLFHGKTMCEVLLESTEDKMYIKVRNELAEETVGQRKGLSSLKEMISKLNYGTSVSEEEGLKYAMKTDKIYETTVVFAKELMFIDEEW